MNKFNFDKIRDNMLQVRRDLPVILANQTQNQLHLPLVSRASIKSVLW